MATVFKGVQVSLNRPVAIKILLKKMTSHSSVMERFKRESMIIAQLTHPNIIHVIDRGVTSNRMPYFVMEYVEGTDLSRAMKMQSLDFNNKLDIVIQICKALSYAHKNSVVHRDIKPANVMLDEEGIARVLDFGIAQFYDVEDGDFEQTKPGTVMGTLAYMSPEQHSSPESVTALSDIYSLGVIMYELFTGEKPVGRFRLPSEINPDIPETLQEQIMSCLESEPFNRPFSADDIKDRLLKLLGGAHLGTAQVKRASLGISNIQDKFALLDVIKEKKQGSVYLYEDKSNKKLMVIKSQPSTNSGFMESKLLTSLKHKNIANILGTSKNPQSFIIVMEYLSGGCLKDRMVQPHPLNLFVNEAVQICEGLSFAHRNRIVHGNLRPSNLLYAEKGTLKITDFGLDEHYAGNKGSNWFNMYNEPRSFQTDILAAGVIFYQMLTGELPVWQNAIFVPTDRFKRLPENLQKTILRMLSKTREKRPANFDEVIKELKEHTIFGMDTVEVDLGTDQPGTSQVEAPTETTVSGDATVTMAPGGSRVKRSVLLLFLLLLFAIAYLFHTKNIDIYIDFLVRAYELILALYERISRLL